MTRWPDQSLVELIQETGVPLKPKAKGVYVGPHPHKHDSTSGTCLVVWERGNFYCSSCGAKGDAADWLVEVGKIGDRTIENRADADGYLTEKYGSSPQEWQQPVPFPEIHGPPFPVDALPDALRRFAEEQAEDLQVPVDLTAGLALSVASAAGAGRATVQVKPGWQEPLNLFLLAALNSGERKSPAFRATTAPLEEIERELVEEAKPELARLSMEHELIKGELENLKKAAVKAGKSEEERESAAQQALDLAAKFAGHDVPSPPRLLCDDVTAEALASLLAENEGVMALFSSEGGIFETMAGRYSDGRISIDVYLKGYSGDPMRVDRKSRPPEFVPRPLLTMCLCVQPEVIRNLSDKPGFRGRGLLARPLYILPESLVGHREQDPPPVSDSARSKYSAAIRAIARLPKEN